ncbi:MAG: hypothetical protein Q9195_003296 [Heterodermia aff. obscurata]
MPVCAGGQWADLNEKVAVFPEIDITDSGEVGLNDSQKLHRSVIQGGSGRILPYRNSDTIKGALITGGVCLSYWLDFGFSFLDPSSVAWRCESSYEYSDQELVEGKEDEATTVLASLSDLPSDDPYIQSEFAAIKDTVLEMSKGSFADLFTMTENRHLHRTVLAYVNQVFQQISGINLITYCV